MSEESKKFHVKINLDQETVIEAIVNRSRLNQLKGKGEDRLSVDITDIHGYEKIVFIGRIRDIAVQTEEKYNQQMETIRKLNQ